MGQLGKAADVIVQRFRAVEANAVENLAWPKAQLLEALAPVHVSSLTPALRAEVHRQVEEDSRLQDPASLAPWKSGKAPWQQPGEKGKQIADWGKAKWKGGQALGREKHRKGQRQTSLERQVKGAKRKTHRSERLGTPSRASMGSTSKLVKNGGRMVFDPGPHETCCHPLPKPMVFVPLCARILQQHWLAQARPFIKGARNQASPLGHVWA